MSIPQSAGGLIESRDDLVRYLAAGSRAPEDFRIGTEHEKFVYDRKTYLPLEYEGTPGIRVLLEGMRAYGWEPVLEGENIIGLTQNGASLSLEPGGQFELSGAPLKSVHETCKEVHTHQKQVKEVAEKIGIGAIGLGYAPDWRLDQMPWMPKGRYRIMRDYMPKVGGYGHEMMQRTCTIQVNLDFSSEADMVKKFRVGLALQPVATALFANSPFREGKDSGFLSYRAHIWTDVDNERAGMLPFAFEDGFGFERYVDYVLDVPMYFVYRDGKYIDVSGKSFRDFLDHKIPEVKDIVPSMADWADHLTTIFPEVRLKKFLEMRGADGGSWRTVCRLPALWTGIYYDQAALDAAWDLVKDWTADERQAMRDAVPRLGFKTPFRGGTLHNLAQQMLEISAGGLRRRAVVGPQGNTEDTFLDPLFEMVERGQTRAEMLLEKFHGAWKHCPSCMFKEYDFL
ncbi:MAG: glutamate--cysteine ligase [Rhizomicrobium sp.]